MMLDTSQICKKAIRKILFSKQIKQNKYKNQFRKKVKFKINFKIKLMQNTNVKQMIKIIVN